MSLLHLVHLFILWPISPHPLHFAGARIGCVLAYLASLPWLRLRAQQGFQGCIYVQTSETDKTPSWAILRVDLVLFALYFALAIRKS